MSSTKARTSATTFLRWAGSKRKLLPKIQALIPEKFNRYIEPFAGSAILYFNVAPDAALLGDLNPELVATLNAVKSNPYAVSCHLSTMRRSKARYLQLRALEPSSMGKYQRAARFIYLNRYCFNGLYRTNQSGQFNVPFGGKGTGSLPSSTALRSCAKQLRNAQVYCCDFGKLLKRAKQGDFVYMDPPFAVTKKRVFNEYDPSSFSLADTKRLRKWLLSLRRNKVKFIVSYADSAEARILRKGFDWKKVTVRRNIAGFTDRRVRSNEILILNL